jgi:hypothetical protein
LGFAQHQNESHSVILHARIGQKCDFSKNNSIDKLEAIVGLRSSGLLTAYQWKIFEDHIDLNVTIQDIL